MESTLAKNNNVPSHLSFQKHVLVNYYHLFVFLSLLEECLINFVKCIDY